MRSLGIQPLDLHNLGWRLAVAVVATLATKYFLLHQIIQNLMEDRGDSKPSNRLDGFLEECLGLPGGLGPGPSSSNQRGNLRNESSIRVF